MESDEVRDDSPVGFVEERSPCSRWVGFTLRVGDKSSRKIFLWLRLDSAYATCKVGFVTRCVVKSKLPGVRWHAPPKGSRNGQAQEHLHPVHRRHRRRQQGLRG